MAVATGAGSTVERVQRKKFALILLAVQIILVILYSVFAVYDDNESEQLTSYYPGFQDIHLLVFLGFGLLIAFLKRYTVSSIGYNLLIAAVVLQWGTFVHQLVITRFGPVVFNIEALLNGDFVAVAVIVSFGAVLGKLSPLQLLVMAIVEVIFYSINRYIGLLLFRASDAGYSMYVHVFGAYFGLAVSRAVHVQHHQDHPQESRTYQSDILAFIGTLFLWITFPSFNAAFAPFIFQQRAFLNTVLASASAVLVTFVMTTLLSKDEKFGIMHLQNCVLSGAVAVGTSAPFLLRPYGALIIGGSAAIISVLGFTHIRPCLANKMRIHDTRGVHNIHGLPGILAGIIGIIGAAMAGNMENRELVFPALVNGTENAWPLTVGQQAGFQAATLVVTFFIAIIGGLATGIFLRLSFWEPISAESAFEDQDYWHLNEEGMPMHQIYVPPPPKEVVGEEGNAEETVELKAKEEVQEGEKEEEEK